jgi:hypothetical protein
MAGLELGSSICMAVGSVEPFKAIVGVGAGSDSAIIDWTAAILCGFFSVRLLYFVLFVANSTALPFRAGASDELVNFDFDLSHCMVLQHVAEFVVVA